MWWSKTATLPDSERCVPMLHRHVETYGEPPQRVAFDGGYASRENLAEAKKLGVEHVMFHKKRGMEQTAMTPCCLPEQPPPAVVRLTIHHLTDRTAG